MYRNFLKAVDGGIHVLMSLQAESPFANSKTGL
jgi:hypothetical protein